MKTWCFIQRFAEGQFAKKKNSSDCQAYGNTTLEEMKEVKIYGPMEG